MNHRVALAVSWVLIGAGVALALATMQFPFTAGSSAADLLAPLSALGCGIGAAVAARRARRGRAGGRWYRGFTHLSALAGILVALWAALLLAFIFLMCGAYWARGTC